MVRRRCAAGLGQSCGLWVVLLWLVLARSGLAPALLPHSACSHRAALQARTALLAEVEKFDDRKGKNRAAEVGLGGWGPPPWWDVVSHSPERRDDWWQCSLPKAQKGDKDEEKAKETSPDPESQKTGKGKGAASSQKGFKGKNPERIAKIKRIAGEVVKVLKDNFTIIHCDIGARSAAVEPEVARASGGGGGGGADRDRERGSLPLSQHPRRRGSAAISAQALALRG